MKFLTPLSAFLSMAALCASSPAPVPVENGVQVKRDGNGATCSENDTGNGVDFTVQAWGPWSTDWGKGFLDNLRGECGNTYNWQYSYDGDGVGTATFTLVWDIPANCVGNAIWDASNPTGAIWGVDCN